MVKNNKKKKRNSKSAKLNKQNKNKQSIKQLFSPEGGWKGFFSGETLSFIVGILLLIVTIFMLLSFISYLVNGFMDQANLEEGDIRQVHNWGGSLGAITAKYFIDKCFGVCAFFIPLFLLLLSMKLMKAYSVRLWKWFMNFSVIMIWGSAALSFAERFFFPLNWTNSVAFKWGGGHGDYIRDYGTGLIGATGLFIVLIALAVLYLLYLTSETKRFIRNILNPGEYIKQKRGLKDEDIEEEEKEDNVDDSEGEENYQDEQTTQEIDLSPDLSEGTIEEESSEENDEIQSEKTDQKLEIEATKEEDKAGSNTLSDISNLEPYDPRKDLYNYKFPSLGLLKKYDDGGPNIDMAEQTANKDRIVSLLRTFGIEITGIKATIGPTITLYEITPAAGVKIAKIRNLSDDLALNLRAIGVRIIAPIPGKGTIGIEVPNKNPKIVSMESILNSKRFKETKYDLPIALGKTITNEVFMVDLAKMPHLLVAGATGQGKSVGLNAIITSLLYKKHPAELKFVMVDPKKVEFSLYSPIENHFLAKLPDNDDPIITDVSKVVQTLKSLCQLMDHRYDLLKMARTKNIKEYNEKFIARKLNPKNGHEYMPYIVIIIDEFGDLIMTAGKEVEMPIARIAQLARAVGMHMVIATQRPTVNIITGNIKNNFPARMAFKVISGVDSKTILDRPGANQLVGKGDMLFLAGNEPVRVQCAFIDTPEVEKITECISEQQGYQSAYELPEVAMEDMGGNSNSGADAGPLDVMFEEAARLIVLHQQGSTSLIQRKFSIGFNRAGRLMDQLEKMGIVGPTRGAKPREVLIPDEVALNALLEHINAK